MIGWIFLNKITIAKRSTINFLFFQFFTTAATTETDKKRDEVSYLTLLLFLIEVVFVILSVRSKDYTLEPAP